MTEAEHIYDKFVKGERLEKFETHSGLPIKQLYRPDDIRELDYARDLGNPGDFPFTRGIFSDMYRGRFWTERPLTGLGTPRMSNERIKFLFRQGAAGWNLAPDAPLHVGLDPDHPLAQHEIGLNGVSMCCLEDMEVYLEGLPLGKVSPNIVITQPGSASAFAAYIATAQKQGVPSEKLLGGIQNDPFNQHGCRLEAQTTFLPLELSVRLCADTIEWCAINAPKINCFCVNCYNMREEGISAAEEIAFGLSSTMAVTREVLSRGRVGIDDFAPRFSYFCSSDIDFFEEIAKFRAFRRMYARMMRDEFGAQDPRSCRFRLAVETSGSSLTTQQPLNNIVRAAIEGLAAILGGCQSLYPACFDEGLAIPSEVSSIIALRTQQILGYETNVVSTVDPLGGSYFIEHLTNRIEEEAHDVLQEIEREGGTIEAMKNGWRDRRMDEAKIRFQNGIQQGDRIVVGVNAFKSEDGMELPGGIFELDPVELKKERIAFVKEWRERRDNQKTRASLESLGEKVASGDNLIPFIVEALKSDATFGEIGDTLRESVGFVIRAK